MANALGVRFNATSTGTGDFVDASVVTGYRRGASNLTDGATYRYRAENSTLSEYEWGTGVWTSSTSTLARTAIFASSTGSKVSFTSVPQVAVTIFPDDVREVLIAARDYYVRTDGSDSNTGLANTAGGAFLTIAKALSVASTIDCSAYQLTINVAAGTYTAAVSLPRMVAGVIPILTGVGSTTIISLSSGSDCITSDGATPWQVNNMKLTTTAGGSGLLAKNGGVIKFSGIEFGAISTYGIFAQLGSTISSTGSYSITGSAQYHIISNGFVTIIGGTTVTLTGTPAFSGAFVLANRLGVVLAQAVTYSGSATGTRYSSTLNSVIDTAGGGANYFPGNVAGSTATGGQYN